MVRRVEAETGADKNVPVVCEFPDVFSEKIARITTRKRDRNSVLRL